MVGGNDDDIERALEELPLFPLRGVVLFPGMALPLHVFEPRYRQMTRDVLDGHRCLAVVHVPDRNVDLRGNPPICRVAGIGTIVEHEELPDGRYHILLVGRARVRLEELPFVGPYRKARASVFECTEAEISTPDLLALRTAMAAFGKVARRLDPSFDPTVPEDLPLSAFADACAARLVLDAAQRQRILETPCTAARFQMLTEALTLQHHDLDLASLELN